MCNCHITYELVTDYLWNMSGLFMKVDLYGQEQPGLFLTQVAVYENSSGSYM